MFLPAWRKNEGDNAVSNILTLDTGADISGNATGGVAVEGAEMP